MKRYLLKLLLFLSPILLIVGTYVIFDPFKVIWHYDNYYANLREVVINRGYVSTQVFDNQNDTAHYDSFIFGNSTSLAYHVEEWQKYIGTDTHCFHFDAMRGTIEGMYLKVRHIVEHQGHIKNALVILDHKVIGKGKTYSHLFMNPPALVNNENFVNFHWTNFLSFVNLKFVLAYFDYRFTGKFKPYMAQILSPRDDIKYNNTTNEIEYVYREQLIAQGEYYNPKFCAKAFKDQHSDSTDIVLINNERRLMLKEMAEIFKQQHTRVKVVIAPFYDQIRINPIDLQCLQDIFGKENVYDFSGPNKWNSDYHNYYDAVHYRPHVATEILNIIYSKYSENSEFSEFSEPQ